MSDENYNPNSVDATLSRIESKLNDSLSRQEEHARQIGKIWSALGRLDVRVATIAGTVSGIVLLARFISGFVK